MATVKLTDKFVTSARAPEGQRLEVFDGHAEGRGLILRVTDRGVKTWVVRYRTLDGRQPRFTLGNYPELGLADAREQAQEVRRQARKGVDPAGEKRKAKARAAAAEIRTFDDLVNSYFKACETGRWRPKGKVKRARSLEDERGAYRRHIEKPLGGLPVGEVTRSLVRSTLRDMVERGITAQTNKAHQVIRQAFSYAIAEEIESEIITTNPAQGFPPLAASKPSTRIVSDADLKKFWTALFDRGAATKRDAKADEERAQVGQPMRIALALCALLLQRKNEVIGMRLDELDLDRGLWVIPAERMKGNRPHTVPLPGRAVELIREAIMLKEAAEKARKAKEPSPCVFPSPRNPNSSVRPDSVSHAMAAIVAEAKTAPASPHDLRRTGSTHLTSERLGVSPFIRSQILGHSTDAGGGAAVSRAHYDLNSYIVEKRAALTAWEGLLLEVVGERPKAAGNVTKLKRAAS